MCLLLLKPFCHLSQALSSLAEISPFCTMNACWHSFVFLHIHNSVFHPLSCHIALYLHLQSLQTRLREQKEKASCNVPFKESCREKQLGQASASTKWLLRTRQIRPHTTLMRLMLKSATWIQCRQLWSRSLDIETKVRQQLKLPTKYIKMQDTETFLTQTWSKVCDYSEPRPAFAGKRSSADLLAPALLWRPGRETPTQRNQLATSIYMSWYIYIYSICVYFNCLLKTSLRAFAS